MKCLFIFDFDGTITSSDSTKWYYKSLSSKFRYILYYYVLSMPFVAFYKLTGHGNLFLKKFRLFLFSLRRSSSGNIDLGSNVNIDDILNIVKPGATEYLSKVSIEGHDIVIVSAGISQVIAPFASRFKANLICNITTEVSFIGFIYLSIASKQDCDRVVKKIRIEKSIDLSKYDIIYAFGDTENDKDMLSVANIKYYQSEVDREFRK